MVVVEEKEFPTPIACIQYLVTSYYYSTHDLHRHKERGMGLLMIQAAPTRLHIDEEACWNCAYIPRMSFPTSTSFGLGPGRCV